MKRVILIDLWQAPAAFHEAPNHPFPFLRVAVLSTLKHRVSYGTKYKTCLRAFCQHQSPKDPFARNSSYHHSTTNNSAD